ncbi:DNA-binding response OmpR family regulator [Clostridium beijerinckii]|nr:DNA-binding response OmpR family regulator [Clostridium beijerinckii]
MNNKFKILVVDDEQNILDVIKAYLEKDGFDVITAMDGKSALDIYSNEKYSFDCSRFNAS